MRRITTGVGAISLLIALAIPSIHCANSHGPAPESGSGIIDLNSRQWLFNPGDRPEFAAPNFDDQQWRRIGFPHNWFTVQPGSNARTAWYRLRFKLPRKWSLTPLMLRLGPITDVDETYLNGHRIGSTGRFGSEFKVEAHAYDRVRLYTIPVGTARHGEENVLAIRVRTSFTYSGGFAQGGLVAELGPSNYIQKRFFRGELAQIALTVLIVTVGLYFLFLSFRLPDSQAYLLFALFVLNFSLYGLLRTQLKYWLSEDFLLLKQIEYLSLCLVAPLGLSFVFAAMKRAGIRAYERMTARGVNLLTGGFLAYILFTKSPATWDAANRLVFLPFWIGVFLFILYFLGRHARRRQQGARLLLFAMGTVFIGFLNDALVIFGFLPWGSLGKNVMIFLILSLAAILTNRMVMLTENVERNASIMGTLYAGSRLVLEENELKYVLRTLLGPLPFRLSILFEFDQENGSHHEMGRIENHSVEPAISDELLTARFPSPEHLQTATREMKHVVVDAFALENKNERIGTLIGLRSNTPLDREARDHTASTIGLLSLLISSRRMREKLIQQERLSALGGAASSIVHDLKGPLHIIQGYSSYLAEQDVSFEERKHYVEEIFAEIEEMDSMTREILEYSRDEIVLNKQAGDLRELMAKIMEELGTRSDLAGIKLSLCFSETIPLFLDYRRMRRVLLNLINNAVEALRGRPEGTIEINHQRNERESILLIQDNGPGIPEEIRTSLFDPFVSWGKTEGTGLGTAIARKIVEAHGGRLWFETDPKVGTTFFLALPRES